MNDESSKERSGFGEGVFGLWNGLEGRLAGEVTEGFSDGVDLHLEAAVCGHRAHVAGKNAVGDIR